MLALSFVLDIASSTLFYRLTHPPILAEIPGVMRGEEIRQDVVPSRDTVLFVLFIYKYTVFYSPGMVDQRCSGHRQTGILSHLRVRVMMVVFSSTKNGEALLMHDPVRHVEH
jgi:hypothetical protein